MAFKSRLLSACSALLVIGACGGQPGTKPTPSGPAAAVQTNSYHGEGVVKNVYRNPKAPAIEIDHGDIDGLMGAMQMEFPVTDPNLLNGIAVNDRVDFTIQTVAGEMRVSAIKKKE